MALVDMTEGSLCDVLGSDGIVFVDCWANWKQDYRSFTKVFESLARKYPQHTFAKLDAQREPRVVADLGLAVVPCLLVFKDGVILVNHSGDLDRERLEDIVRQVESLDMEIVRSALNQERHPT